MRRRCDTCGESCPASRHNCTALSVPRSGQHRGKQESERFQIIQQGKRGLLERIETSSISAWLCLQQKIESSTHLTTPGRACCRHLTVELLVITSRRAWVHGCCKSNELPKRVGRPRSDERSVFGPPAHSGRHAVTRPSTKLLMQRQHLRRTADPHTTPVSRRVASRDVQTILDAPLATHKPKTCSGPLRRWSDWSTINYFIHHFAVFDSAPRAVRVETRLNGPIEDIPSVRCPIGWALLQPPVRLSMVCAVAKVVGRSLKPGTHSSG